MYRNKVIRCIKHMVHTFLTHYSLLRIRTKLPPGFNDQHYLQLNPDLKKAGVSPAQHYYLHGQYEGRPYTLPKEVRVLPGAPFTPTQKTILVIDYSAPKTAAAIRALNIVQCLSKRYNVVVLLSNESELTPLFQSATTETFLIAITEHTPIAYINNIISIICQQHTFLFALANCVGHHAILSALASYSVPTISLLHEFVFHPLSNTLQEICNWSTKTIFSTQSAFQNAISNYEIPSDFSADIVPPGSSMLPAENILTLDVETEQHRLSQCMRPEGKTDTYTVILGTGAFHFRNGIELFIACAAEVVQMKGGEKCRFIWIGPGYNPKEDIHYSTYLADQIQRAGLEKHVIFAGKTTQIEWAYGLADIFLLPSRLDSLPNVAVDAMFCGLPVLCFDKATDIADFLKKNALGKSCVAGYLDTHDLSQKIAALVTSAAVRKTIGEQCKKIAITHFHMEAYVMRLEAVALAAQMQVKQIHIESEEILCSECFQPQFASPGITHPIPSAEAVRTYVQNWKTGIAPRKPFPGFHPGIYRALQNLRQDPKKTDPLVAYLREKKPKGPWCFHLIRPLSSPPIQKAEKTRIALHIHAYYPELLSEIMRRLTHHNTLRPDLFINVPNTIAQKAVTRALSSYAGKVVEIQIMPNQGRDIGPFLTGFGKQLAENYEIVGHLHTKKSTHYVNREFVTRWKYLLLENLLGGEKGGRMADTILTMMSEDPSISIVFPEDPHIIGWTKNRPMAEQLAPRLGLSHLPEAFNFPMGTMFWMRTSLLRRFVEMDIRWEEYPPEPLPIDGSMLHAIERLFGVVGATDPFRTAVTYVPGVGR